MATIFINTENSKTTEPNRFRYLLTDKTNLKNRGKQLVALANISVYYTWQNVKKEYKKTNLK